jgi:hypothetical protein
MINTSKKYTINVVHCMLSSSSVVVVVVVGKETWFLKPFKVFLKKGFFRDL